MGEEMKTAVLHIIIFTTILGSTTGAGVLPDGPLVAGGSVIFNTTNIVAEPPFTEVTWKFGSKRIILTSSPSGDRVYPGYIFRAFYYSSTVSLELRDLTVADTGYYHVEIFSDRGVETGSIHLTVHEVIYHVALSPLSVNMVELSGPVSLICSAYRSSLSYVWMKDRIEVTANNRVQITDGGTNLTITNVMREDDGFYECMVTNPVSSGSSNLVKISISSSSNGLSGGAIAGIVITCLVVTAVVAGYFYVRKVIRNNQQNPVVNEPGNAFVIQMVEVNTVQNPRTLQIHQEIIRAEFVLSER